MPDDAHYARKMAAHLGIKLHEIEIAPDIVDLLPRMVDILDEPIGDPAAINTLLMCDAARASGVKVLLSGMGADELFGGYRKHLANLLSARYRRVPRPLRTGVIAPLVERMPVVAGGRGIRTVRWAQRFLTFAELGEEEAFRRSYTLHGRDDLLGLLDPELAGSIDGVLDSHRAVYADDAGLADHVNRMCLADSRMFMQGLNLTYTDRASMAASTEVRVPFVDPVVFEAAFSLSGKDKIHGRVQKAALKAAARAWVPGRDHRPAEGVLRGAAAGLGHQRPGHAHRRPAGARRAGGHRLPAARAAVPADRRPALRPAGQLEADLAAAQPRALVPQRARRGGGSGMKQVAQNYRSGELVVLDVPVPACRPGGVLVRSLYSLISTGTEMMKVSEARLSLLGKAKARPDQVKKLVDSVAQQGPLATYKKAMNRLDSYTPLGYSLCGVVVEVGAGAEEFQVGDMVAAAGNEFALHAEVNWVPTNLVVRARARAAPSGSTLSR